MCSQDFAEHASCPGPGLGFVSSLVQDGALECSFPPEILSPALPSTLSTLCCVPQLSSFPQMVVICLTPLCFQGVSTASHPEFPVRANKGGSQILQNTVL